MKLPDHDLYFITDSTLTRKGELADVKAALAGGAKIVQYRDKTATSRHLYETALEIKELCHDADAVFIVNDRMDIALAAGADGVHIGQKDIPGVIARLIIPDDMILGISATTMEQARQALDDGADYLGAGPVFATATKVDADPATGTGFIGELRAITKLPVVAIGGITMENATDVIRAGADSVCAISATVATDDVCAAVRGFESIVSHAKK